MDWNAISYLLIFAVGVFVGGYAWRGYARKESARKLREDFEEAQRIAVEELRKNPATPEEIAWFEELKRKHRDGGSNT